VPRAGRERRRGTTELPNSAPRPLLHRVTAGVLPVWLAAAAAYRSVVLVIVMGTYGVAALYEVPASSGLAQLAPASFELRAHQELAWWVSPAHATWFGGLAAAMLLRPSRFEENQSNWPGVGAPIEPDPDPTLSSFGLVTPGDLGTDSRLDYFRRDAVVQDMLLWDCSDERHEPVWTSGVLRWAHWQAPGDMDGMRRDQSAERDEHGKKKRPSVVETFDAMSDTERTAWFTDYFAAARGCDPEKVARP
jgi:hypothetical protein